MMRNVSPSRSADTFYYHVKLIALKSAEAYAEPFQFKINLMKGIQRLDTTRKPHSFEGNELELEDVVTFQMPFYNPTKKKIDFSLLLVELAQGETELCSAAIPVGDHTEDFMKDATQRSFEGSTEFDDGNFSIDYVLYIERSKANLLALVTSGVQLSEPKLSARGSKDDSNTNRSSKISEAQSPLLETRQQIKLEPKPEPPKSPPPTKMPAPRELKSPPTRKIVEPEPLVVQEQPPAVSKKPAVVKPEPKVEKTPAIKIEAPKGPPPKQKQAASPLISPPVVIPPPPDRDSETYLKTMNTLAASESAGQRHLKAPKTAAPLTSSIDIAKHRKQQDKPAPVAEGGGKLKLILAAVIIAALVFGFLFMKSGSSKPKAKQSKKKTR